MASKLNSTAWQEKAAGRKLVLQLGEAKSGLHPRYNAKEYHPVRAAFTKALAPDIVLSETTLAELPTHFFDAIWATDFLEHHTSTRAKALVTQLLACVKDGGEWGVIVPDMEALSAYIANGKASDEIHYLGRYKQSIYTSLFGLEDAPYQSFFNATSLAKFLRNVGIGNATIEPRDLCLWAGATIYPKTSARYKPSVRVINNPNKLQAPVPAPLAKQPHPGQFAPNMLSDELDIPPMSPQKTS